MDQDLIVRIGVGVVAFVFADLLFVEIRRAVREAKRAVRRVSAYGDLPIFSLLASADRDVERMLTALAQLPPLVERAEAALAAIRRPFRR